MSGGGRDERPQAWDCSAWRGDWKTRPRGDGAAQRREGWQKPAPPGGDHRSLTETREKPVMAAVRRHVSDSVRSWESWRAVAAMSDQQECGWGCNGDQPGVLQWRSAKRHVCLRRLPREPAPGGASHVRLRVPFGACEPLSREAPVMRRSSWGLPLTFEQI